ncbi:hypothetical protein AB6A40_008355 [Gnathostoma spinigerum]|uniref:Uncharacterized protein n=1 Tax=Gnathostoma spinigerum TaxID=75299 RepID=A0ABD6EQR7_9BILA
MITLTLYSDDDDENAFHRENQKTFPTDTINDCSSIVMFDEDLPPEYNLYGGMIPTHVSHISQHSVHERFTSQATQERLKQEETSLIENDDISSVRTIIFRYK